MNGSGRPTLADQVYDQLLGQITDETYAVHARLPNEDALAHAFGVSRPVIRSALARLRTDGIIQSRRGSGSYVTRRPDRQVISFVPLGSISDIQKCYEFRIDLEGAAAAWAARRRDDRDLERMEEAYRELEANYQQREPGIDADQRLHLAIAEASKNGFFVTMLQSLGPQIAFGVKLSRSLTMLGVPLRQETVLAEHRAVVAAIRDRDPVTAERAMRDHISAAKNRMFVGEE
ncbi:FadR/GntR family transcriptional regulator [Falsirhodobacter algicola]|uniref:FCD domain-containing protein n=1 Tax=Falsirhodobacter algicola TaxID=2692330 RepID=A0A8J8MVZ5_9RHOB|nr:FadR/GntR family transcriptional regulator [Falsirhodobacter algicola]QUS37233.1 FCD domain-containing protein [Falsirhodobacter algicola]